MGTMLRFFMDASHSPNSVALLDLEQLHMLLEAGASDSFGLLREILDLYEEESRVKLGELQAGLDSGDHASMGRAAHALAGSSANIGGRAVWQQAKELEDSCKNGQGPDMPAKVQSLEEVYWRTLDELKAFLARAESGN